MPSNFVLLATVLFAAGCAVAEEPSAPAASASSNVQKLDGPIDSRSTRVLLPDDPLPNDGLVIDSGADLQQHACAGKMIEIRGDYRIVELTDTCSSVRIRGNFNVIRVRATDSIDIIGSDNAVTWNTVPGDDSGRKKPLLSSRGERNLVAPGD